MQTRLTFSPSVSKPQVRIESTWKKKKKGNNESESDKIASMYTRELFKVSAYLSISRGE